LTKPLYKKDTTFITPSGHIVEFLQNVFHGDRVNEGQCLIDSKPVKHDDLIPKWFHEEVIKG